MYQGRQSQEVEVKDRKDDTGRRKAYKIFFNEIPLKKFINYLFLLCLGLSCGSRDLLLWCEGSLIVEHGLSCPLACGILVP